MLTKADDFPIHQTPDPIAFSGTDRNFYDRYFFNGYDPDGTEFFAAAFGVYPHLNIADAHFAVVRDGVEYCLHASRVLHMERMDLTCGPIRIEVLEPLQQTALLDTLITYLAAEQNIAHAADALFVHPNTVRYRLSRIEQILGAPIGSTASTFLRLSFSFVAGSNAETLTFADTGPVATDNGGPVLDNVTVSQVPVPAAGLLLLGALGGLAALRRRKAA